MLRFWKLQPLDAVGFGKSDSNNAEWVKQSCLARHLSDWVRLVAVNHESPARQQHDHRYSPGGRVSPPSGILRVGCDEHLSAVTDTLVLADQQV